MKEINWGKVLRLDKYKYRMVNRKYRFLLPVYAVFKNLIQTPLIRKKNNESDYLFVKSMQREDYNNLYNLIIKQCSNNKISLDIKKSKKINFEYILIFVRSVIHIKKIKDSSDSTIELLFLYAQFVKYNQILLKLKGYSAEKIVVFSDMQPIDNMIVQYFNNLNKKTVTLQHGLYVDYKNLDNINTINYTNIVSKFFLAWGEETKELVNKHQKNTQVIICGKPIENIEELSTENYFTVIFDQNMFKKYNKEMLGLSLRLAEILEYKLNIKFHPSNFEKDYQVNNNLLLKNEDIKKSKFIIGHTSSLMFELMRQGFKVLKYESKVPSNKINKEFTFNNINELLSKINTNHDYEKAGKYYIEHINGDSLFYYKNFFEEL